MLRGFVRELRAKFPNALLLQGLLLPPDKETEIQNIRAAFFSRHPDICEYGTDFPPALLVAVLRRFALPAEEYTAQGLYGPLVFQLARDRTDYRTEFNDVNRLI